MKFKITPAFSDTIKNGVIKLSTLFIVIINISHSHTSNYSMSGNPIWDELLKNCRNSSSGYLCVQNNLFRYVDSVLLNTEFHVTDSFYFKNKINSSSSHHQVPLPSNQIPLYRDSPNDEDMQFNRFIDELETVEQKLDADEKSGDNKSDDERSRRKKLNTKIHDNRSEYSSEIAQSEDIRETADDDIIDSDVHSTKADANDKDSNGWKSVVYTSPSQTADKNMWSIDLDQIVNLKPEWQDTKSKKSEGPSELEKSENSNQDRWIPKTDGVKSVGSESKKKISSRIKHGRSMSKQSFDQNENGDQTKESSTNKGKVEQPLPQNSQDSKPHEQKPLSAYPTKAEIEENMIPDSEHMPDAPYKTIYDVSTMFYEKSVNYFMNHDLIFFLPKFMFGGAQITLSPKSIEADGGINLRLNINSLTQQESPNAQGRLFLKHFHKHIKHMFKHKLMSSLLALMMLIKMIKMKLWFVLPLLVGVGAAKKILLKVLLFLFPALAHLFKLCSYYHHHATRLHLHHHKIKHHHHHVAVPVPIPPPYDPHIHDSHHSSYDHHPSYHSAHSHPGGIVETGVELDHPPPGYEVYGGGGGPPGHSDYYPSRNDLVGNKLNQHGNIFDSWGLNDMFPTESPGVLPAAAQAYSGYVDDSISALNKAAATNKLHQQQQQAALVAQAGADSGNYNAYLSKLARLQALKQRNYQSSAASSVPVTRPYPNTLTSKYNSAAFFQNVISPKSGVVQTPPTLLAPPTPTIAASSGDYDEFFSPILGKVDQIFTNLAVYDEPCRERLVCNMYRTPDNYSPHSNLVSNELSRDPSELPKTSKLSVPAIRFYKYVQSAREGQDNHDCAKLYPLCAKSL